MKERGIEQFDFVYVIGDAYVDHSSFGPAIISRVLEANGYSVGIISQPDWLSCLFRKYGFHGQPLYRGEKAPKNRCLYAGRCHGKTAGPRGYRVRQSDPENV